MQETKEIPKKPVVTGKEALFIESAFFRFNERGGAKNPLILHNIDLVVQRGDFVSIVGPSGCGKSTLLKLITGEHIIRRAERFDVLGKPAGFPDCRRGVVFQDYSLAPHLTVFENILLGLEFQAKFTQLISRAWRKRARDMVRSYLDEMRLSTSGDKYPRELSGGMRQRAAIAQTLVTIEMYGTPELICMDEPYGALDASTREDLQVFILKLWEKYKRTILFVTHDLEEALFLGTRLVVLSQYWSSDIPEEKQEGSRITLDLPLTPHTVSTDIKKEAAFGEMIQYVRNECFNPRQRKHVNDFNTSLLHRDSFQTLSLEESKRKGVFFEADSVKLDSP